MLKIKNLNADIGSFKLRNINLEIKQGEYFVLAGRSGSGKSILLESIAGIFDIKKGGEIILDNRNITNDRIQDRGVGLVFQDNTLFPHLTVKKNIEFALKLKLKDRNKIESKILTLASELNFTEFLDRKPATLSGGENQRVLLARTLASEPKLLLLDEPLSAVDADRKDHLKMLLRSLHAKGQTIIHVTHDFEEAFSLATRIGIMHNGKLLDTDTPQEIISNPRNKFIARYCGNKNYFRVQQIEPGKIEVERKLVFSHTPSAKIEGKMPALIDASKIKILNIHENPEKCNTYHGHILDKFNTIRGIEISVDIGIVLSVLISDNSIHANDLMPGQEVAVYVPDSAFRIIQF